MGNFKNLIFIFSVLFLASNASFATAYIGILQKKSNTQCFIEIDSQVYKIITLESEIQNQLRQLNSGDQVIGQGEFTSNEGSDAGSDARSIVISSIDYVGLTNILGVWLGENIILKFKNFNEFSIYEFDSKESKKYKFSTWNYSLSPLDKNEWALFYSDDTQTNLGRIEISQNRAVLDLLNTKTGEIVKTTPLHKPALRK